MSAEYAWVTTYDLGQGYVTITLAEEASHHWEPFVLDAEVSSPGGEFTVYRGTRSGEDLLVRVALDVRGPVVMHSQFNLDLIGSMTIWPGLEQRFAGWSASLPLWLDGRPTSWETSSLG